MKRRVSGNNEKLLADYDHSDRKHSGRWDRVQRSRSHSRSKRRRRKASARLAD